MNDPDDKSKKRRPSAGNDGELDLPPQDGDDIQPANASELASYIDPLDEFEESFLEPESRPKTAEVVEDEQLVEAKDESWLDEEDQTLSIDDVELSVDDDSNLWSDDDQDDQSAIEGDWFVEEDEELTAVRDEPVEADSGDDIELEADRLDEFSDLEADDESPSIEEVMAELDIELPFVGQEEVKPVIEVSSSRLLESHFLGPIDAVTTAAALVDGKPIGVGQGLFALGADGLLHQVPDSKSLADSMATSICSHQGVMFIGTQFGGAVITRDHGRTYETINNWHSLGFDEPDQQVNPPISTPFYLTGQPIGSGYRIIGRTGNGQLFVSDSEGQRWSGVAMPWHCLAVTPIKGTADVIALFESNKGAQLVRSTDLKEWKKLRLPDDFSQIAPHAPLSLDASNETIVIAADDSLSSLIRSLDGGETWTAIDAVRSATAVALDSENPGWIAAAVHQSMRNQGVVRISEDGGTSWQTALITCAVDHEETALPPPTDDGDEGSGRVDALHIEIGRTQQIIAVTPGGIYKTVLAHTRVQH